MSMILVLIVSVTIYQSFSSESANVMFVVRKNHDSPKYCLDKSWILWATIDEQLLLVIWSTTQKPAALLAAIQWYGAAC